MDIKLFLKYFFILITSYLLCRVVAFIVLFPTALIGMFLGTLGVLSPIIGFLLFLGFLSAYIFFLHILLFKKDKIIILIVIVLLSAFPSMVFLTKFWHKVWYDENVGKYGQFSPDGISL